MRREIRSHDLAPERLVQMLVEQRDPEQAVRRSVDAGSSRGNTVRLVLVPTADRERRPLEARNVAPQERPEEPAGPVLLLVQPGVELLPAHQTAADAGEPGAVAARDVRQLVRHDSLQLLRGASR